MPRNMHGKGRQPRSKDPLPSFTLHYITPIRLNVKYARDPGKEVAEAECSELI